MSVHLGMSRCNASCFCNAQHDSLADPATLDCYMEASLSRHQAKDKQQAARRLTPMRLAATLPARLLLPTLSRWHVTTQDRLFFHLRNIWGVVAPRAMMDLGSHASHGHFTNLSDALLFLDAFHAPGTQVVGVDAFEDFALDLQRRFDTHPRYGAMVGVEKRSLALGISEAADGSLLDFTGPARMHSTCCADGWCSYTRLEKERGKDHLCSITRMRLGLLPRQPWLPPSSYPVELLRWLGSNGSESRRTGRPPKAAYNVRTIRLSSLWQRMRLRPPRRLDIIKIDIDADWRKLGGLEELLMSRAIGVLTIEVDGSWGRCAHRAATRTAPASRHRTAPTRSTNT